MEPVNIHFKIYTENKSWEFTKLIYIFKFNKIDAINEESIARVDIKRGVKYSYRLTNVALYKAGLINE